MSSTSNTTGSRVYVTQENAQLNYGPAEQFGEICFLTRDEVSPVPGSLTNAAIMAELSRKLQNFNFDNDYLTPSGSPVVCGMAFLVLGGLMVASGGCPKSLRVLRWSNRDRLISPSPSTSPRNPRRTAAMANTEPMTDAQLEAAIAAQPFEKVTKNQLEERIRQTEYFKIGETVTVCNLTLDSGFSVRGESACVDPRNYDEAIGREIAYRNAFDKLWQLEGYLLADRRMRAAISQFSIIGH